MAPFTDLGHGPESPYIITAESHDGRRVYFDGFGFTLLRANALVMNVCEGISTRSAICHAFPECRLVPAVAEAA